MSYFAANAGTPPMWSECSWVTRIAVRSPGRSPRRAMRATVSRMPNPQSTSTRVAPFSTTSPLPSLPLPREAKRTRAPPLLQLVFEKRQDLLAGNALVGRPARILHGHHAARVGLRDGDPVLLGFFVLALPEHEFVQEAFVLRGRLRIGVADEILALRAVAIDDGEADPIERQANAAPRAIEAVVEHELIDAIRRLLQLRPLRRAAPRRWSARRIVRLRFRNAESHHQAREPLGVEAGVGRQHRPRECGGRRVVDLGGGHLLHDAARYVDVDRAGIVAALDAAMVFLAFVRRVEKIRIL